MKKSLIVLAVAAGSIAAAQADDTDTTTLYGSIAFASQISDSKITKDKDGNVLQGTVETGKEVFNSVKDNHWDINQTRARLGVKGKEHLDNGLKAIFTFEVQNDGSSNGLNGTRDVYVGLEGDFGTVTIGRQGSTWNVDEDYFETSSPAKEVAHPERSNKTIKYATPDFGGFTAAGRIVADGSDEASFGVDKWDTAVAYNANGIMASAAYGVDYDGYMYLDKNGDAQIKSTGSTESMGAQVGYKKARDGSSKEKDDLLFSIHGNVQHESSANTVYNVQGQYFFGGNNTVRAGFGYEDVRDTDVDNYSVGLGYQYDFSKRTYTWVEAAYSDVTKGDSDGDFSASVGIRHDF